MKFKTVYACSFCGKKRVKLWKPFPLLLPLICAKCAEERQSALESEQIIWIHEGDGKYSGLYTGRKFPVPKWTVDNDGKVPSYTGQGPYGVSLKTDKLIIDLSDISFFCSGTTEMVPAYPTENGAFWDNHSAPDDIIKWWKELPTR